MNTTDIRKLFDYTEWANELVLAASEKLTADQVLRDAQISHKSIMGTLVHMAGAEWIWLERWLGNSPGPDAWGQWTVEHCDNLHLLRTKWQKVIDDRAAYLGRLTDEDLTRDVSFRRVNGEMYTMPLGPQLQHVVNHATLHRGQVVGMIRQLGITPPTTDLLFYLMTKKS